MSSDVAAYSLHILRAVGLPKGLEAYVKIHAGDFSSKTRRSQRHGDPVWNEQFLISAEDPHVTLSLQIKHVKRARFPFQSNPSIGTVEINILDLARRTDESEISLPLGDPSGNNDAQSGGSIIVRFVTRSDAPQDGFTVLSKGTDGMKDPIVDIVFVHGLGGHPKRTWTMKVPKPSKSQGANNGEQEIFWPNDLLPKKLTNARILTYGYDSDIVRFTSQVNRTNIFRLAGDMLSALERERSRNPHRPIIFIAHSLGGILVKDALQRSLNAKYQEHLLPIFPSTLGIIFMGTPHRGISWVPLAKNLCNLAFGRADTEILAALGLESEVLERIAEDFAIMLKNDAFKVHAFYETKDISGWPGFRGRIVDRFSATIGDASEGAEGIDDDHIGMCKFNGPADHNFRKVLNVTECFMRGIQNPVGSDNRNDAPTKLLSINFTGREDEVKFIRSALSSAGTDKPGCCAVYGMPGIGKSQLVLHYAVESFDRGRYSYVFWTSAKSIDELHRGLVKILSVISHPDRVLPDPTVKSKTAQLWLENSHVEWLIIFDNVSRDVVDSLRVSLPRTNPRGHILFTTRTADVAEALVGIPESKLMLQLRELQLHDTADLLLKNASVTATPPRLVCAKKLVECFGRLPLAVYNVASYMKRTGTTVERMQEMCIGDLKIEMLKWKVPSILYEGPTITSTFDEQLAQLTRESQNLFKFLSFLNSENIPIEMVRQGAKEWLHPRYPLQCTLSKPQQDISSEFNSLATLILSDVQFAKAIQTLLNLSLVAHPTNTEVSSLWMQGLFQFMMQDRARKEKTYRGWLHSSISFVCGAFRCTEDPTFWWADCGEFLPHVRSLNHHCSVYGTNIELAGANARIAKYWQIKGRYNEAEVLCKQVLECYESVLGSEDLDTLIASDNLGKVYYSQGRRDEAEAFHKRAVTGREKQLGADPFTVTSMNNLAALYESQGRYDEAEPLHKRALECMEKHFGDDHPSTVPLMNNLAAHYKSQGRYSEAEPLHKQALACMEKHLGVDHPSTVPSVNNLAALYELQGRYDDAELLHQRAFTSTKESLGPDHPSTLTSMSNLAALYESQGRYDEAELLYKRVLAKQEKRLGDNHPSTLTSMKNLATLYEMRGLYSQAEPLRRRELDNMEKHMGADHPSTLSSKHNLAFVISRQQRYAEAEDMYQTTRDGQKMRLGPNHPSVLTLTVDLAFIYELQERYDEAKGLYEQALDCYKTALGANHPQTQKLAQNLANFHRFRAM